MYAAVLIMAVVLPMMLAAAFLLGRHFHRRQYYGEQLSLVTRQHIDLFQGGQLNEALVEAAKSRFRSLLERGEVAAVEASLRPGIQYVVQVRALAEIGTDDAGRILERQLQRRLSEDKLEQSWYWIDVANGLRSLNRQESLPHLLRCAEAAVESPLGHFFAAETLCFLGFAGYLREVESPLGYSALRVLHQALEGLHHGVQPALIAEARLGEMIETLWDHRPERVHPLLVRVFAETIRLIQRACQPNSSFQPELPDQETFDWQISRLAVLEPVLADYLSESPHCLCQQLPNATRQQARDILLALIDLRADVASKILPLLKEGSCPCPDLAVELLRWSSDPQVGAWLRGWLSANVSQLKRAQRRRQVMTSSASRIPPDFPYPSVLRALRGFACVDSERILMAATADRDPRCRLAAVSSLGWWEPVDGESVLDVLQTCQRDPSAEVRQAARAALARLGERHALQWFRHALTSEEPHHVHDAVQVIASEGLILLLPDLDRLVDSENPEVAHHAREAIARLFEEMDRPNRR